MKNTLYSLMILMLFFLLSGCSGKSTTSFTRENVPLDFLRTVAVLPLENNTDEKFVQELARDILNTEILAMNLFDVVDKGIVDSISFEEGFIEGSSLDQQKIKRLGQRLGVEGLIIGSVDLAGDKRTGSIVVPEISMTLRLIEIKSGTILWQASGHNDGDSMVARLFGINPDDSYNVTTKLIRNMLLSLPEKSDSMPVNQQAVQ